LLASIEMMGLQQAIAAILQSHTRRERLRWRICQLCKARATAWWIHWHERMLQDGAARIRRACERRI
jgi:hypothetical protein